jgi:cyclophilin family peptidyl-prolyl cis-trans isomerase
VDSGFYNNTIFHRVIADFVIQGGGYTPGTPNPVVRTPTQPPIVLESNNGLNNVRGSLAMARTSDPNSATSQFYINVVDNPSLDYKSEQEPGYAVFGTVTAGMEVVDAISVVPTRAVPSMGLMDLPVTNVIVTTARQVR